MNRVDKNQDIALKVWNAKWSHLVPQYTLCFSELDMHKAATCKQLQLEIVISIDFLKSENFDENYLQIVFAHEVAHALTKIGERHGPEWKAMCLKLGGNGRTEDTIPSYYCENHYFKSRVNVILQKIPQNKDITSEDLLNAQKTVMMELIQEGHDPTKLLEMYMKDHEFT